MKPSPMQAPKPSQRTTRTRNLIVVSVAMAAVVLGLVPIGRHTSLGPRISQAQNFGQRTIEGKVVDDTGTVVGGANVFLKNLKNRDVKSFTSTSDGSFRFAQVGMVDDYEVWAEQGKKESARKTISSFDSRKLIDLELKLK